MKIDGNKIAEVLNTRIVIEWQMGNWCNFKCPYCFDTANLGTHKAPEVTPLVQKNVTHLVQEIRKQNPKQHIQWTLSGGEPTAQKKFEYLLKTLNDIDDNSHVMLVTNGTRPIAWWKNNIHEVEHVILSHHIESKIEHNIELLKLFAEHKTNVAISVMAGAQNFDQAVKDYKILAKLTTPKEFTHIKLMINRFRLTSRNNEYIDLTKEQGEVLDNLQAQYKADKQIDDTSRTFFRSNRIRIKEQLYRKYQTPHIKYKKDNNEIVETLGWYRGKRKRYEGNWIGYKCYAESHAMHITYDGSMGKIPCKVVFFKDVNIFDEDFVNKYKYNSAPYICDKTYVDCNCVGQLEAKKVL